MFAPNTKSLALVGVAFVLATIGFVGGFRASTLPPRITEEQRLIIQATRVRASVGVAEYKDSLCSDKLREALLRSELFDRVDHLKNFSTPPDLVVQINQAIGDDEITLPFRTLISLGVIPAKSYRRHGFSFSISRTELSDPSDKRIPVRFVYSGPTIIGWWAIALNMLEDQGKGEVERHPRFIESFSWEIAKQRSDIEALIAQKIGKIPKASEFNMIGSL